MHFLKPNQALIINNKTDHEKEPYANLMTSNDNSYNK
jgi:hypothetical protein